MNELNKLQIVGKIADITGIKHNNWKSNRSSTLSHHPVVIYFPEAARHTQCSSCTLHVSHWFRLNQIMHQFYAFIR